MISQYPPPAWTRTENAMNETKRKHGDTRCGTAIKSQREIGEMFGVTLQAVQCIEYRALKKIRAGIERAAAARELSVKEWLFGE